MKIHTPDIIIKLVERFKMNSKSYKSSPYKEAQVREEFINPLFSALGWDVTNIGGRAEDYKDVILEDSIKIQNKARAPDYSFRIGGRRIFFVEAKKPNINLNSDFGASYQIRRYAWSAKLPLSILTDFEEFSVYDCRTKPLPSDNPSVCRIRYYQYDQYPDIWDDIASVFSRTAIVDGSFDKFAFSDDLKKGTSDIDSVFLKDIENWRIMLSKEIAKYNCNISDLEINSSVQLIIDRLLFLRVCEDRGIEEFSHLKKISESDFAYRNLIKYFKVADQKYNSGLFHLKSSSNRPYPEEVTPKLTIPDLPIRKIISTLYYPSPYEFSVLPVDIIGEVYEKMLTKKIHLTSNRQVKLKEKTEVKKNFGVFYTPNYIVERIVKSVFEYIFKTYDITDILNIKILDPAIGSGAFLTASYDQLLDWYRKYYIATKQKNKLFFNSKNEYVLTILEKKRILKKHLFGVDIDPQAVELSKLSLLLKVLEQDDLVTYQNQFSKTLEAALPDLSSNIKCGNSLISTDYYRDNLDNSGSDEVKPFDWQVEFSSIVKSGGFDVIIGNPPYGAKLTSIEKKYLKRNYSIGTYDTAGLFIVKSYELLKSNGVFSMIVPKAFLYSSKWNRLREILFPYIYEVTDVGKVWKSVKLEQCIISFQKSIQTTSYKNFTRHAHMFPEEKSCIVDKKFCTDSLLLNGLTDYELKLGNMVRSVQKIPSSMITNQRGVSGLQKKLTNDNKGLCVLGGKQISRFRILGVKGYYTGNENELSINGFAHKGNILAQNIISHIRKPRNHIKIISTIVDEINSGVLIVDTVNQINCQSLESNQYLLALLCSRLINWYIYRFVVGKAIRTVHFDKWLTDKIPFRKIDFNDRGQCRMHDDIINLVNSMQATLIEFSICKNQNKKVQLERKRQYLEDEINRLVYNLYDIGDSEARYIDQDFK